MKKHALFWPALLAGILLSGCATHGYQARPLDPAGSAARWQQRSLADSALQAYMAAQGSRAPQGGEVWRLPELTLAALFFHPDLDLARAQWRAAAAARETAAARANPTLDVQVEHHAQADGKSPWTLGLGIDLPLDLGDRRAARIEQATALAAATRLEIGGAAWQVRSRLRARLVDALAAAAQRALRRDEVALREEYAALLDARLRAGMVGSGEAAAARAALQQAQGELAGENARADEARAALAAAIGVPAAALAELRLPADFLDSRPAAEGLPAEDSQRAAVLNRLDLRAGLARYAAAEAKLRREVARQYPEITLGPGLAYDQGDRVWSLGVSLLLALFDRNTGPIAEAEAQREIEGQRLLALQARVLGEQAAALAGYRASLDEIERAADSQRSAARQLGLAERQFAAGQVDRLERAQRRLEAGGAERRLLAARVAAQRAFGRLEDAVQQPLDGSATPAAASLVSDPTMKTPP